MPSVRIKREENSGMYFLTLTVKRWYYLFDRHNRWDILLESLRYCRKHKGLDVFAWVFMLNHIHLMARSADMVGFVRDFKKHTSKELKKNIAATEPNILKLFASDGEYCIWKDKNMPKLIRSDEFYRQKAEYIECNPVRKGYVKRPQDWIYSSANEEKLIELVSHE